MRTITGTDTSGRCPNGSSRTLKRSPSHAGAVEAGQKTNQSTRQSPALAVMAIRFKG